LKRVLVEIAAESYTIPGSHKTRVSMRTLERWIAHYRRGGWDALKPQPRPKAGTRIAPAVLQKAVELRKTQPSRSVEQLIFLLEHDGTVKPGEIAYSTLARHLRKAGASRSELRSDPSSKGHRRFEAADTHLLWQADFQHTLYLPDPDNPKKRKKALLFAIIDDHSRLIVHAEFYWDERLPRLEDALKKAILRHGVPEQFYCDNGAVFTSHHLVRICGKLGIRLSHSRPYRPQGRGKIEKFFRFIDSSFKPEAYAQIQAWQIATLGELNAALAAWLDGFYHVRKHGGTGEPPLNRAARCQRVIRRVPVEELMDIFLWEETRKADKTGCVSLMGNIYEMAGELTGLTVTLRFDPFDLKVLQVWHQGRRFPNAVPLDLSQPVHQRVKGNSRKSRVSRAESTDTLAAGKNLNFFALAEEKRRANWGNELLTYAQPSKEDGND